MDLTTMNSIASKLSALFGSVSMAGGIVGLLENQSVLSVGGIALGIMFFLYAAYRFPNDQALKTNKELQDRIDNMDDVILGLKVQLEKAVVHRASLEQKIEDAGLALAPAPAPIKIEIKTNSAEPTKHA